ncbi:MAG: hypothetical protein AUK34_01990 [Ignavibacteria bacterium CG2_30_36_16]|nr:hypothetical protein [Ignavibacteria bacterium]OIP63212.1 MAG: hypothetical protein AUK34_01990 [Ignavibacteria bacterium CG2_30_36_16]PJB00837.1 MAG: hypothetical protein CO127_06900 [Ignavibacteria bacterium CG_4_9_14_3_um_filter_36_18]
MKSSIYLFPLNLVVFPDSRYPLHIFEERYKKMIASCIEEKKGFGIVAVVGDDLSTIGSYVVISSVLKKYDSGEYDIIVAGRGRFITKKVELHEDGYHIAEVEYFNDEPISYNPLLLEELQSRFEILIGKFNFTLEESFWDYYYAAEIKSFKMAEKAGLSLIQQQALLSIKDENKRLTYLIEHFKYMAKKLSKDESNKTLVLNDGYIN